MDPELLRRLNQQRELLTLPRLGTRDPVGARPVPPLPQPGRVPVAPQDSEPHVYGRHPRGPDGRPQAFYREGTASDRGVSLNFGVLNGGGDSGNGNANAQVQLLNGNAVAGRGVGADGRPVEGLYGSGRVLGINVNAGTDPHGLDGGGYVTFGDVFAGGAHSEDSIRAGAEATLIEVGGSAPVPGMRNTTVRGSVGIGVGGTFEARCAPAENGRPQIPGFSVNGAALGKFGLGIDSDWLNYIPGAAWLAGCPAPEPAAPAPARPTPAFEPNWPLP